MCFVFPGAVMERQPGLRRLRGHRYEPSLRGYGPGRPLGHNVRGFIILCTLLPALAYTEGPTTSTSIRTTTPHDQISSAIENSETTPLSGTDVSETMSESMISPAAEMKDTLPQSSTSSVRTTPITPAAMSIRPWPSLSPTLASSSKPITRSTFQSITTSDLDPSTLPSPQSAARKEAIPVASTLMKSSTSSATPTGKVLDKGGRNDTVSGKEGLRYYDAYGKAVYSGTEMDSSHKYHINRTGEAHLRRGIVTTDPAPKSSTHSRQTTELIKPHVVTPFPLSAYITTQLTTTFPPPTVYSRTKAWLENGTPVTHVEHDTFDDGETTTGNGSFPGWPTKMAAVVEGDLVLGGLMMVHEREDTNTCGPIMPQGGVQALEAMLYTLDVINADKTMLPGITLGAHILDDCDKDTYGLEMAVDFIKGKIPAFLFALQTRVAILFFSQRSVVRNTRIRIVILS